MSVDVERITETSASAYFSRIGEIYGGEKDAFLINPFWSEQQRAEAEILIRLYSEKKIPGTPGKIFIASGGSGGRIRFIAHSPETLEASARALRTKNLFRNFPKRNCSPLFFVKKRSAICKNRKRYFGFDGILPSTKLDS